MKRILSMLLCLLLYVSLLPVEALAAKTAEESEETEVVIETEEDAEPAEELEEEPAAEPTDEPTDEEEAASAEGGAPDVPQSEGPPANEEADAAKGPSDEPERALADDPDAGKGEDDPPATRGITDSGTCGDNLTWTLYDDGRLVIEGTGEMNDYWWDISPWGYSHDERNRVRSVEIRSGVTSIGNFAFKDCNNLTSVSLPQSLRSIRVAAFDGCEGLKTITIPEGVTSIGVEAFANCGLKNLSIPSTVRSIGAQAFEGCTGLTSVTIPEGVTSIERDTFYMCNSMSSLTIPSTVTSIGLDALARCWALKSITLPAGLTSIEMEAFLECGALRSVTFLGGAPAIGRNAFDGVRATAYYPGDDASWTASVRQGYGGRITWVAYYLLAAPVLTEAFNSATGVRVSWQAVDGAAKYRLLRKDITAGINETQWKNMGETTELTLIDKTAKSSHRYTYTVVAIDGSGEAGRYDAHGRTCTYIAKADITKLTAVSAGVKITWSKPAGAKNFRVMRREDGANTWTVIAVVEGTTYTDTTAPKGVKLWYTVRGVSMDNTVLINSYNGTGWSIFHVEPPVLTEAFNSATGVRVSWQAREGAAKYRLLRKNVTAGDTSWTSVGETADCSLIDKTAQSATRYSYAVECVDANGRTCSTISASRTCTYIAMAKITSIKSVSNGVQLTWSKPAGAKNFRVLRRNDGTNAWTVIAVVEGTSYTDTTAPTGVKLWYTVRAVTMANDMYINSYNGTGWSITR